MVKRILIRIYYPESKGENMTDKQPNQVQENSELNDKEMSEKTGKHSHNHKNHAPLVILSSILGVLLVAMIINTGWHFIDATRTRGDFFAGRTMMNYESNQQYQGYRGGMNGGGMMRRSLPSNYQSATSQTIVSGVVVSVSSNSFVIAGNGQQYTVNTSGSTTWNTTDKSVSKNDSIVATGTLSEKTLTANDIRIINY